MTAPARSDPGAPDPAPLRPGSTTGRAGTARSRGGGSGLRLPSDIPCSRLPAGLLGSHERAPLTTSAASPAARLDAAPVPPTAGDASVPARHPAGPSHGGFPGACACPPRATAVDLLWSRGGGPRPALPAHPLAGGSRAGAGGPGVSGGDPRDLGAPCPGSAASPPVVQAALVRRHAPSSARRGDGDDLRPAAGAVTVGGDGCPGLPRMDVAARRRLRRPIRKRGARRGGSLDPCASPHDGRRADPRREGPCGPAGVRLAPG